MEFKVTEQYIHGVELVQKEMQKEIGRCGIAIETNPSSNYMIGTIDQYDQHPIVSFYNNGLTTNMEELDNSSQLWVSINTDDQGVFGTMLGNEYAFMARALERKQDEQGRNKYKKT